MESGQGCAHWKTVLNSEYELVIRYAAILISNFHNRVTWKTKDKNKVFVEPGAAVVLEGRCLTCRLSTPSHKANIQLSSLYIGCNCLNERPREITCFFLTSNG